MVNSEKINSYLNYNYIPFNKNQCIKRILIMWIFSIIVCFIGNNSILWALLLGMVNIAVTTLFIFLITKYRSLKLSRYLCDSIFYLYIGIILTFASYRVMVLSISTKPLLLISMMFLLVIWISIFMFAVVLNIKRNKYSKNKSFKMSSSLPLCGAMLGILISRVFLSGRTQDEVLISMSIMLFILSLMVCLPSVNLMKVFFCLKNTETGDGQFR